MLMKGDKVVEVAEKDTDCLLLGILWKVYYKAVHNRA